MVIHSAVQHFQQTLGEKAGKPHIVINNLEHNSVTLTVRKLEEQGKIGEGGREGQGRRKKSGKGGREGKGGGGKEERRERRKRRGGSHPNPFFIFAHTHISLPLTPSPISLSLTPSPISLPLTSSPISLHPSHLHIEVTEVKAAPSTGAVSPADIAAALRPTTILISLMLANNETGVIQPVGEVVRVVRGEERERGGEKRRIFVHTDAAQVRRRDVKKLIQCTFPYSLQLPILFGSTVQ